MFDIFNQDLFKNAICYSLIKLVEDGDTKTFKDFIEKMKNMNEHGEEVFLKEALLKMKRYIEYPYLGIFNNFDLFKTLFGLGGSTECENYIENYFGIKKEVERNLLIKIFKGLQIKDSDNYEGLFEEQDLRDIFYFQEKHIKYNSIFLFEKVNGKLKLLEKNIEFLETLSKNLMLSIDFISKNNSDKEYIKLFDSVKDNYEFFYKEPDYSKMKELAKNLHYRYIDVYSPQLMENRGTTPEKDLNLYYDHFNTLEDLYEIITQNLESWKSRCGDKNLNKSLDLKVYTTRWGHDDNYKFFRKYYGWEVNHIMINGESTKSGFGKLFENLRHDSVQIHLNAISYALETLWNIADSKEMSIEELQEKLSEIADWISDIEKNARTYQPNWINYM